MEPPETGGIGMLSRLHQAIASPNWVIPSRLVVACIRGARLSETGFAGYPRIPGAIVRLLLLLRYLIDLAKGLVFQITHPEPEK